MTLSIFTQSTTLATDYKSLTKPLQALNNRFNRATTIEEAAITILTAKHILPNLQGFQDTARLWVKDLDTALALGLKETYQKLLQTIDAKSLLYMRALALIASMRKSERQKTENIDHIKWGEQALVRAKKLAKYKHIPCPKLDQMHIASTEEGPIVVSFDHVGHGVKRQKSAPILRKKDSKIKTIMSDGLWNI